MSVTHLTHRPRRQPQTALRQPQPLVPIIESIATGTPEHIIPQREAAQFVAALPSLKTNQSRIAALYHNTRIQRRHLAVNLLSDEAAQTSQQTIQQRMQQFKEKAVPLAETVVKQALADAKQAAITHPECPTPAIESTIGLIVLVTSTGFVAPGVDAELIERLGLRRDIARVTVNFMGCAAAMNGLRVACDHVKAYPTHRALVICLELSSVNAVFEDNLNDVIIHSIFGDGCAAVIVGAGDADAAKQRGQIVVRDHFSYLVENTQDGITLGVQDTGITCKLSRQLPDYISAGVGPIVEGFLAQRQLTKTDIDFWAVHPGGTRIIENVQRSLQLTDDQLTHSWDVLAEYGNMLSASVLFVIKQMVDQRISHTVPFADDYTSAQSAYSKPSIGIAFSFSPGVGIEGLLFETK